MPKERRARSVSFEARSRASPYPCISSSSGHRGSSSSQVPPDPPLPTRDIKEWDEVRCPVCMEHPHNAVLLCCTSSDKGCHPFMCNTSYRHSNCLDQYKKAFSGSSQEEDNVGGELNSIPSSKLSCPLCRGGVTGWTVVESARRYMDSKARTCSKESCGFVGSYRELRKHARTEHPLVRPSAADPDRQRDWRRMEQQWDMGDLFSSMRSSMRGVDGGGTGGLIEENGEISLRSVFPVSSVAVLFIIRFTGAVGSGGIRTSMRSSRSSLSSRVSSRSHRGRATNLWGETYSEPELAEMVDNSSPVDLDDDDDDDDDNDDNVEVSAGAGAGAGAGNGSGEVDVRPAPSQGRHRRQLRMPQEEMDDDDL